MCYVLFRADFEELCADLIARLEVPLKKVLADSGAFYSNVSVLLMSVTATRLTVAVHGDSACLQA